MELLPSAPQRTGAVSNGTLATHCHNAWGQWAVELLSYTAVQPGGNGSLSRSLGLFASLLVPITFCWLASPVLYSGWSDCTRALFSSSLLLFHLRSPHDPCGRQV